MRGNRLLVLVMWVVGAVPAGAQFREPAPPAAKPGQTVVQRWRVGMVITAEGGGFRGLVGSTTVPTDWPEQKVRVVGEDLSPGVSISYRNFEGTARQLVVRVPALRANEEARAVLTFEIQRHLPLPPQHPEAFQLPDPKKLDRKLAAYLGPSPAIEADHPDVKRLAQQLTARHPTAWAKVRAIYDWVRKHVERQDNRGQEMKGTVQTLNEATGDCDEMTGVFVALCRALGVPARMVRVPGHVFGEFYLLDAEGKGHWFPCEVAAGEAFGTIADPRPILQKGDNILAIDPQTRRKTRFRILPETLTGSAAVPGAQPKMRLICEPAL